MGHLQLKRLGQGQLEKAVGRSAGDPVPAYKVILHNDDANPMGRVADWVFQVTPLKPNAAYQKMIAAHEQGQSVLVVVPKETAELYRDQLSSKGLTVTIEPA